MSFESTIEKSKPERQETALEKCEKILGIMKKNLEDDKAACKREGISKSFHDTEREIKGLEARIADLKNKQSLKDLSNEEIGRIVDEKIDEALDN